VTTDWPRGASPASAAETIRNVTGKRGAIVPVRQTVLSVARCVREHCVEREQDAARSARHSERADGVDDLLRQRVPLEEGEEGALQVER